MKIHFLFVFLTVPLTAHASTLDGSSFEGMLGGGVMFFEGYCFNLITSLFVILLCWIGVSFYPHQDKLFS